MRAEALASLLAQRVMRWDVAADRFLMGERRWSPRWRFQPTEKLEDAFRLLDAADPIEYRIDGGGGTLRVRVRIGRTVGEAQSDSRARAITYAIARAIGIDPG